MPHAPAPAGRPFVDRVEVAAPSLAAIAASSVGRLPVPIRQRVPADAFARAEAAFNRGDFEAIFADDVHYVPPPPLGEQPISGRTAVLAFWKAVAARFERSTIENLSVEEVEQHRFVRTARITHRANGEELSYVIRQVTELRGGRVVSQINEQVA
jgi:hypothetical protein